MRDLFDDDGETDPRRADKTRKKKDIDEATPEEKDN